MENLTQRWIKSGPVFQNKDTLFYFQKMAGEASSPRTPPPPHSPSCAPELPAICLEIIFKLRFLYLASLTH